MSGGLLWYLGAINAATFVAFGIDKRRARLGVRRLRERTLHLLALAGGSAGAFVAMRCLRHKNRKPAFRNVLVAILVLHGVVMVWWTLEVARA